MLTKREKEVLKLFCYSNREIANILHISIATTKNHVSNILHKLESKTKISAAIKALKLGIIKLDDIKTEYIDVGFWDETGEYLTDMQEISHKEI